MKTSAAIRVKKWLDVGVLLLVIAWASIFYSAVAAEQSEYVFKVDENGVLYHIRVEGGDAVIRDSESREVVLRAEVNDNDVVVRDTSGKRLFEVEQQGERWVVRTMDKERVAEIEKSSTGRLILRGANKERLGVIEED